METIAGNIADIASYLMFFKPKIRHGGELGGMEPGTTIMVPPIIMKITIHQKKGNFITVDLI